MTQHTAYLAPPDLANQLRAELQDVVHVYDRLIVAKGPAQRAFFAQNIWHNATFATISSTGEAAKILRGVQRNWWPYHFSNHRRMHLIQVKLPHLAPKPLAFLGPVPAAPLGSYTLVDENTLLYAGHCSSPMPNGEWNFVEDKDGPPSRAYLKLWELFTRTGIYPGANDVCLDLGASPGGWTWVLAGMCKQVFAFDRSPLAERIADMPNVQFFKEDAFKVDPGRFPDANWILSDVVCYPEKLFERVDSLLRDFPNKNYVFTIKFQGADNSAIIEKFAALPGDIVHLHANKHELTWAKCK